MTKKIKFKIGQKIYHGMGQEYIIVEVLKNSIALCHGSMKTIEWFVKSELERRINTFGWKILESNQYIL